MKSETKTGFEIGLESELYEGLAAGCEFSKIKTSRTNETAAFICSWDRGAGSLGAHPEKARRIAIAAAKAKRDFISNGFIFRD